MFEITEKISAGQPNPNKNWKLIAIKFFNLKFKQKFERKTI